MEIIKDQRGDRIPGPYESLQDITSAMTGEKMLPDFDIDTDSALDSMNGIPGAGPMIGGVGRAGAKIAQGVGKVAGAVKSTGAANSGANVSGNAVKLEKQLASEEQLSQLASGGGTVISQPAKQAERIAAETGRNPENIQKVSSDARIARDGQQVQTHSFRDASTNELIEPKTIINE